MQKTEATIMAQEFSGGGVQVPEVPGGANPTLFQLKLGLAM